jgi:hypothetical protein
VTPEISCKHGIVARKEKSATIIYRVISKVEVE